MGIGRVCIYDTLSWAPLYASTGPVRGLEKLINQLDLMHIDIPLERFYILATAFPAIRTLTMTAGRQDTV